MEQTNHNPLLDALERMLESKIQKYDTQQALKQKMFANGYTENDYKTFNTLRDSLSAMIEAGGVAGAIAEHTDHLPSATYAVATAIYLQGAAKFMYAVMDKCNVDPNDFGLRSDPDKFFAELGKKKADVQKVIDKHEFARQVAQTERA